MNRYFSIDDYSTIGDEARSAVDNWLTEKDLMNSMVTLIEEREDDTLFLSGPIVDAEGFASEAENEVKAKVENDFPWEIVEKSLAEVVKEKQA